jgi:GNAT superfamily N-acetyltransferase
MAQVAGSVLGAGALLVPTAFAGAGNAPLVSLAVAGCLVLWSLLMSASGGSTAGGSVGFVRARLGDGAGTGLTAMYFAGFVVGQAAIAMAAGAYAARAAAPLLSGRYAGPVAVVAGMAVLALAAGGAIGGVPFSSAARRVRLTCALALAVAGWLRPDLLPPTDDPVSGALLIALPVLFAWVGLEGAIPGTGSGWRMPAASLCAVPAVAVFYAVLLAPSATAPRETSGVAALPVLYGLSAMVVCASYCLTNLRAMGAQATRLRHFRSPAEREASKAGIAVAFAAACAVLTLAHVARWGVATLLLGPGAMTAGIYLVMALAALRPMRTPRSPVPGDARPDEELGAAPSPGGAAIVIRAAVPADLPAVAELCAAHAAYEKAGPVPADLAVRLEPVLFATTPRAWCLVAERDGELIGYTTYSLEFSTWEATDYVHMDCLFIAEPHRGGGLGRRLLDTVRDAAGALGARQVQWQTPDWNADAIRFYDRAGASARSKMRYALPTAGPGD